MRRIYVASSWRNTYYPDLLRALTKAGHSVYDFRNPLPGNQGFSWAEIDARWQDWKPETYREALRHPMAKAAYSLDSGGMAWANTCVLVLPAGRSAHTEAFYMAGQGKPVLIYIPEPVEAELMYLLAGSPDNLCVTVEELLASLRE